MCMKQAVVAFLANRNIIVFALPIYGIEQSEFRTPRVLCGSLRTSPHDSWML